MMIKDPAMLWHLLWIIPLMLGFNLYNHLTRQKRLNAIIQGKDLQEKLSNNASFIKRLIKQGLNILIVTFVLVALAEPHWGQKTRLNDRFDTIVVFDVSRSMLAKDVAPNRLEHGRKFINDLSINRQDDRFGLISFAARAFPDCPLTSNHNGFRLYINNLSTDELPGGSNIEHALNSALKSLKHSKQQNKCVILISDGEELQGDYRKIINAYKKAEIPIFTIGVGKAESVAFIHDGEDFLKDKSGKRIETRLNEDLLKTLAAETNGFYIHSTSHNDGIEQLNEQLIMSAKENHYENEEMLDQSHWPLILAVLLFFLRLQISERRHIPVQVTAIVLMFILWSPQVKAEDVRIQQLRNELQSTVSASEKAYINYKIGRHFHRNDDIKSALQYYDQSLELADKQQLKSAVLQNIAVISHESARQNRQKKHYSEALKQFQRAILYYREAMRQRQANKYLIINYEQALREKKLTEKERDEALKNSPEYREQQEELKRQQAAQKALLNALKLQQQANESSNKLDQQRLQEKSQAETMTAHQNSRREAMQRLLARTIQAQTKALTTEGTEQKAAGLKAEALLKEALKSFSRQVNGELQASDLEEQFRQNENKENVVNKQLKKHLGQLIEEEKNW